MAELIDELIADDLARVDGKLEHHFITVGLRADGTGVAVPPYGVNILIAGPSGSGTSTVAGGIVERLIEQVCQVCVIDPRGRLRAVQGMITPG